MTKKIDRETLIEEILEQDGVIELSNRPTKHDCSMVTVVVPHEGKHWQVSYERSYNNGIEDDEFEMVEVEPYEVTVTKWRTVK